ncbi:hypothetical protein D3C79_955900 [compost metagenome]
MALLACPGPFIAVALIQATHNPNIPAAYLAVVSAICFIVLWLLLPETKDRDITRG